MASDRKTTPVTKDPLAESCFKKVKENLPVGRTIQMSGGDVKTGVYIIL